MNELMASLGISTETANLILSYGTRIIGVIVILFLAFIVAGWLQRMTLKWLQKIKFDITLAKFLSTLIRWGIIIFTIVGCLGVFGIETTSFAAVLGGASVAIGLAFQGSLGNLAAGAMLLIFRPYKVGDYIVVNGTSGTVDSIELFVTTIDTLDNRRIIMPNAKVFGEKIENVSYHDRRRVDISIGVGYGADIDKTREVLEKAAKLEGVEECQIYLNELGESSVNWAVRCWTTSSNYWALREQLMRSLKYSLDEATIDIPYPQVVVHSVAA